MASQQHSPLDVADLSASVDALRDEVRVLRDVLDEVRDAIQWCSKNVADFPAWRPRSSEGVSLDDAVLPPLAPTADSSPQPAGPPADSDSPAKQRQLF